MGDSDSPPSVSLRFGRPSARQYRRVVRHRRKRWGLLRSWGTSVRSPPSQTPVGPLRLAFEDNYRCGELLLPAAFAFCRCLSPHHRRFLSASRRPGSAGTHWTATATHDNLSFEAQSRGSRTRCLRFAAFLPALAVVPPRKTRFRLVANLYRAGVTTPQGPEW